MYVEIFEGTGTQPWRFRVKSENGEITATSEGYVSKSNAIRAAENLFGKDTEIREILGLVTADDDI